MQPRLAFEVAAESARRALAIDEMLAAAHAQLALAKFGGEWDWDGSEQEFRRALRLDPKDALVHVYYSWLLMLLGRDEAAFARGPGWPGAGARRRVWCAPPAPRRSTSHSNTTMPSRSATSVSDPTPPMSTRCSCVACARSRKARPSEAIADLQQAATLTQRSPFYLGLLGLCYGKFGMRAEALELVAELEQLASLTYVPSQCYVYIYAGLGQREKALAYQEDAYLDGASPFNYLNPNVRDLYALDPRHQKRLEQMRLVL